MIFQILDRKQECYGLYANGQIILSDQFKFADLTKTWNYAAALKDEPTPIECAQIYCHGQKLEQVCPDNLKTSWAEQHGKLKAFFRSFIEAKVSIDENCFFELVPEQFLLEYCELKNKICAHVFENYERPPNYKLLYDLSKVVEEIGHQKLNVDLQALKTNLHTISARNFLKSVSRAKPYCSYDIYGSKTGRLTTRKGSFPILTMNRNYRKILKPNNDWFVEFDFNAAELRVLLSLLNKEQPAEDLHMWNLKNIYRNTGDRQQAKERIFAWLYNPNSKDYLSSKAYDRDKIKKEYWDGTAIRTPFGRTVLADEHHSINYLIQSTCADNVAQQLINIYDFLMDKKSKVAFAIHDSVVIDLSDEDRKYLLDMAEIFANTKLGKYPVNISAGKDFGSMKRLNIQ